MILLMEQSSGAVAILSTAPVRKRSRLLVVFGEFAVKRGEADAENQRGLLLVAAVLGQGAVEVGQLLFAQIILERDVRRDAARVRFGGTLGSGSVVQGEQLGNRHARCRELDDVARKSGLSA